MQKVDSLSAFNSIVLLTGAILTSKWSFKSVLPKNTISYFEVDSYINSTNTFNRQVSIFFKTWKQKRSLRSLLISTPFPFYRLISFYFWGTFLATITSVVFDVGKLWSIFGALHNLFEVGILLLIAQDGKIKGLSYYYLWGTYYLLLNTICVFLDFPMDALFFKVQGK
jgi:hypothetical protein